MGIDKPRPPDTPPQPKPPQPKPPQPDPAKDAAWQARRESTMTRRPERSPDTRQRGPEQTAPRPPAQIDSRQKPVAAPDARANPDAKGRLWTIDNKPEVRPFRETRDVNEWREPRGGPGPVNMNLVRTDFAKDVHKVEPHPSGHGHAQGHGHDQGHGHHPGSVVLEVRLTNVAMGKDSEAQAIERNMTEIGAKGGVHVRVTVEQNGVVYSPIGQRLTPVVLPPPPPPVTPVQPPTAPTSSAGRPTPQPTTPIVLPPPPPSPPIIRPVQPPNPGIHRH